MYAPTLPKSTYKTVSPNTQLDQLEDFTIQKSDGTIVNGRDEATKANQEIYAPFAAHHHHVDFLVCWETDDGWGMIGTTPPSFPQLNHLSLIQSTGVANCYFKLHGLPEGDVTDPEGGGRWHGFCPGSFQFEYVKCEDGKIRLRKTRIFSDSSPAMRVMLKNKMIDGEALAGIVIGS